MTTGTVQDGGYGGSGSQDAAKWILRGGILISVLIAWQLAGNDSVRLGLPTFFGTLRATIEMVRDGSLPKGLWLTNQAMVVGYALSLAVGIPMGIAMGMSRVVERIAQPYITILLTTPTIALVPIIQALFGLSFAARVAIVFLFTFIYMTVNTMAGVRTVDPALLEMARSFGASRLQRLRHVVLPAAIPGIMAGVRLALGRALIGMVVAELSLVGAGVGSLIVDYQVRFLPANVFGIVLIIIVEGVILMDIARRVERYYGTWRGATSD